MQRILLILAIVFFAFIDNSTLSAQGKLSGYLQTRSSFFVRDSSIKAFDTRQYDDQFYSTETWVDLTYSTRNGFQFRGRYDMYLNSNLFDPLGSESAQGLGRWSVQKKINDLDITAGYIYDQIGTGAAFQAYEARLLGIDNALVGLRLKYDLTESVSIKGFVGRQKNRLEDPYGSVIKGINLEAFHYFDSTALKGLSLAPGIGLVNRTIDDETMQIIASNVASNVPSNFFTPSYNNYAVTAYNTLSYKSFSLYTEGVYKSEEAVDLPTLDAIDENGRKMLLNRDGSFLYASLGYARKGLAITAQAKRAENFQLRTSPLEKLTRGLLNFVPPMARQNTYRLATRYNAATQELGELGYQADISYRFNKRLTMSANGSYIDNLEEEALYREAYFDATIKDKNRKWKLIAGLQLQKYNQVIYEEKRDISYTYVETVMPFVDFLYKFNKKTALRTELQYMSTDEDFGSWAFGLMELTYTSKWAITISNMVTVTPETYNKKVWSAQEITDLKIDISKPLHFFTAEVVYNYKANRFSFGRVRQVEGIVCTGGICRYEPAFNGYRLTVRSRF